MNDIMFSRCIIKNIVNTEKYIILNASTKVLSETNSLIDSQVCIYIDMETYGKIIETNKKDLIAVGKEICVTGKTIHELHDNKLLFKVLIQNKKRFDYGRNLYEISVKLLDINTEKLISSYNKFSDKEEFIAYYYNSEEKNTEKREIIVSIDKDKSYKLKDNSSYNIAGKFLLRVTSKILPVIATEIFVADKLIDENIFIQMWEEKKVWKKIKLFQC